MESTERAQVRLILEHERLAAHQSCQERLKALYAEHAAKGCLQSGATARAGVRIIDETGEMFVKAAVDQVAAVAMDIDAFALIMEETESLLSVLNGELGGITFMATGSRDKEKFRSIVDAVDELFLDAHRRITRQLEIHRFTFTKPSRSGLLNSDRRGMPAVRSPNDKPTPARAGRLPADWWDDLWIEIFRQVYLGDLKPNSQADIVKAMQQWLSDRDIDAADSTLKPRARKLLQMLQEAEG